MESSEGFLKAVDWPDMTQLIIFNGLGLLREWRVCLLIAGFGSELGRSYGSNFDFIN